MLYELLASVVSTMVSLGISLLFARCSLRRPEIPGLRLLALSCGLTTISNGIHVLFNFELLTKIHFIARTPVYLLLRTIDIADWLSLAAALAGAVLLTRALCAIGNKPARQS
jgi:hypothetical protein